MMVGSNNGTDLLTRDQGIGHQKDLLGVSVEHRAFDEHDLVLHFDGHTVVRGTLEKPNPVHHLLNGDLRLRAANALRHIDLHGHIHFDVLHRNIEHLGTGCRLSQAHRELQPANVTVVFESCDDVHVGEHRVRHLGVDLGHEAGGVDPDDRAHLSRDREL
jgi:hypothetical protein